MRPKYQQGSITLDKRKVWVFRWRQDGKRRSMDIGSLKQYSTKTAARNCPLVSDKLAEINRAPSVPSTAFTVRDAVDRYAQTEMSSTWSTRRSMWVWINNFILPKWGDLLLSAVKPAQLQREIRELELAPKSKGHIRTILSSIFRCARLEELMPAGFNPMADVRIPGSSKRLEDPRVLEVEEFGLLLNQVHAICADGYSRQAYISMILAGMSLGLRCGEICGLKWEDVNFTRMEIHVHRSVVAGRVKEWAKTQKSNALLPLDPLLAGVLQEWHSRSAFSAATDWVWASPDQAGEKSYFGWGIQRRIIRPAGLAAGLGDIGWHTLRHTYRTWLDETGAPLKVMQELMRHADIRTTMNVYGKALPDSRRSANSKVVQMAIRAKGA